MACDLLAHQSLRATPQDSSPGGLVPFFFFPIALDISRDRYRFPFSFPRPPIKQMNDHVESCQSSLQLPYRPFPFHTVFLFLFPFPPVPCRTPPFVLPVPPMNKNPVRPQSNTSAASHRSSRHLTRALPSRLFDLLESLVFIPLDAPAI